MDQVESSTQVRISDTVNFEVIPSTSLQMN